MLVALNGRRATPGSSPYFPAPLTVHMLAQFRTRAEGGDPFELKHLLDALTLIRDTNDARATVVDMLRSDRPEVRAGACGWIREHPHDALAPLLVPRLSDADWRVRAAAFDAVRHLAARAPGAPTAPDPLRDTPVDQRE